MNRRLPIVVPTISNFVQGDRVLGLAILGSTGSIGRQTLDVVDRLAGRFRVIALAAGGNMNLLSEQIARHRPSFVAVDSDGSFPFGYEGPIVCGSGGMIAAVTHPDVDIVVVATSGHAAILPTARAIEAGKIIALANKETIVCAGGLITALALKHGVEIRPVDSEHSAIWQALGRSDGSDISRLTLTASGGPFRETPIEELAAVTLGQALSHPTWVMGDKVTIDSATLMNKGLELIEAHWLFGIDYGQIDIVVHPESIVHSLIEFADGSQVAQLSQPDMRLPIQFALTFPRHESSDFRRLSLPGVGTLRFEEPDLVRFPSLRLAREAGVAGQTYPTVLSVADEVAVKAFTDGEIGFGDLPGVVEQALTMHQPWELTDFDALAEAESWARRTAHDLILTGH